MDPILQTGWRSSARVLALTLSLAAAPALARDEPEAIALDAGFKATEMATKVLRTAEGQALKGVKKVAVPLFSVEFITADAVSAQTSGFGAAGRSSSSLYYKLKGLDEPDFQALTDALYTRFLADLKEAGIEVLTQEQVAASPTYRKLAAGGSPSPIKSDKATTLAPPGMAIYGFNKQQTAGGGSLFGALSQIGAGFGAVGAAMDTVEMQKELGATVLEVQLKMNFVQLTNNNKGFFGRMASSASVEGKVMPIVASAMLSVQSGTRGSLTLVNPLTLDATAFSEVRKAPTTAADVAGGIAVALIRLASNSKDSSSSDEMEAVADPAKYREIVASGLGTVNQMFVQRLRAGE